MNTTIRIHKFAVQACSDIVMNPIHIVGWFQREMTRLFFHREGGEGAIFMLHDMLTYSLMQLAASRNGGKC